DPLTQSVPLESEPLPLVLSEPPFLVDEEESVRVCGLLVAALENQRWRAQMRNKVDPKKVAKAAAQIGDALNSPDDAHPERGLIVFRLREERSLWLVVNVTKAEENDGVFLVRDEESSTVDIFNMAGDDNQKMLYYPLHLLVVAVRRWLSGGQPRRTVLTGGLPSRWGISTLDSLARGLLQGYLESNKMLSQQPASDPFPVCYDMNDVRAEIAFSISHQEHDTHFNFISPAAQNTENDLISGRVLIRIERHENGARLNVALMAPGFILVGDALAAFIKQAQASAEEIAFTFTPDPRQAADYERWLKSPKKQEEVVIFTSAKDKDGQFRYLAIWPGIRNA